MLPSRTNTYYLYKGMLIGKLFFEAGIGVVTPDDIEEQTLPSKAYLLNGPDFRLKDRQLHISVKTEQADIPYSGATKKACELLNAINYKIEKPSVVINNLKRREEVFIPLIFSQGKDKDKFGIYVYPWVSDTHQPVRKDFQGFQEFITAICIFGSSLVGVDQLGYATPFIKHDLQLHRDQKIIRIKYNPNGGNPYKEMTFIELEKLAFLINNFSNSQSPKKLRIHLPWIDYILFGLELFVKGQITLPAVLSLIKAIIIEKDHYIESIQKIFAPHNIDLQFESPFDNLFPKFISQERGNNIEEMNRMIFDSLGLSLDENEIEKMGNEAQEKKFVHNCLQKLLDNEFNLEHKKIWNVFSKIIRFEEINNLEDLFKFANALILAAAASGKKNYEVCSLLPLGEKQIQLNYTSISKQFLLHSTSSLPAIYMMTFLEPLYGYNPDINNCSLFYYDNQQHDSLVKAIRKGLIHRACENVFLFSNQAALNNSTNSKKPFEIETVLPNNLKLNK